MKKYIFSLFAILLSIFFSTSITSAASLGESCSSNKCETGLECRDFVCQRAGGTGQDGDSCSSVADCANGFECVDYLCSAADGGDSTPIRVIDNDPTGDPVTDVLPPTNSNTPNPYAKPTSVISSYLASTYGVTPSCNCRNGCNDT
jgi:hypothetical protein